MSDFEDKLNGILSNPDAMAQIANLAQSLNLGGGGEAPANSGPGEPPAPQPPQVPQAPSGGVAAGGLGALSGLGSLLGNVDPQLLTRLLPLVGELSGDGSNNERLQLLYALRPFLKPEKQDKVERAVKAARLIHVGKKLLSAMGIPMYNRYVRNDNGRYERIPTPGAGSPPVQEAPPPPPPPPPENGPPHSSGPPPGGGGPHGGPHNGPPPRGEGKKGFLSGILSKLKLEDIDTGDLLLLLLLFLLFKEGEDEELLIALGLLLIL